MTKPCVVILGTGGTIAGQAPAGDRPGYKSGQLDIQEMIKAVPELTRLAEIKGEQIANVGSQDISFGILMRLARRINTLLAQKDVQGVVVTHGTDTMEESAFFLNLTVTSQKPVVLTGSMRPATAISADGPLNLFNAVAVAADPNAKDRGVMVVTNDRIHDAHSLTKNHTTSVETFLSPVTGLMGTVIYGKPTYFRRPFRCHTHASEFRLENVEQLPRVDILYACIDMAHDYIQAAVDLGAKGVVIAGDGNGNMNQATLAEAARVARKGIFIVRSSRVSSGTVGRNMEVDDDAHGFIASDELNPAKARILLMLALMTRRTAGEIQELFHRY
ncbi:MAG: asparaginase [Desulfobacterales bacterium]|nr:asparaginase [Desulfobacterales bacterium]